MKNITHYFSYVSDPNVSEICIPIINSASNPCDSNDSIIQSNGNICSFNIDIFNDIKTCNRDLKNNTEAVNLKIRRNKNGTSVKIETVDKLPLKRSSHNLTVNMEKIDNKIIQNQDNKLRKLDTSDASKLVLSKNLKNERLKNTNDKTKDEINKPATETEINKTVSNRNLNKSKMVSVKEIQSHSENTFTNKKRSLRTYSDVDINSDKFTSNAENCEKLLSTKNNKLKKIAVQKCNDVQNIDAVNLKRIQCNSENKSENDIVYTNWEMEKRSIKNNKYQSDKKRKRYKSNVNSIKRTKKEIDDYLECNESSESDSSSNFVIFSSKQKTVTPNSAETDLLCHDTVDIVHENAPKNSLLKYFNKTKLSSASTVMLICNAEIKKGKSKNTKKNETVFMKVKSKTENGRNNGIVSKQTKQLLSSKIPTVTAQLAPLFIKESRIPKAKQHNIAKQEFLNSGVPTIIKKKLVSKSIPDDYNGEYNFPIISHVRQLSEIIDETNDPCSLNKKLNWKTITEKFSVQNSYLPEDYSSLTSKSNTSQQLPLTFNKKLQNIKGEINNLKKQEPNLDVAKIYSFTREVYKSYKLAQNSTSNGNQSTSSDWTEKYKPHLSENILGNAVNISRLKEWIKNHKYCRKKNLDDEEDSENEFLNSDDSSNSSVKVKDNVAVLVGPSGCGKTCAVYTIARELSFEVLEINAGMNRNGKRILSELLESTQSHQVKHDVTIFTKCKNMKKNRKGVEQDNRTMSLILIEDADILFENYDEGYLSAINSITELSKRPIIFIVNNIHSPYISKYNNQQHLVLHFKQHPWSQISIWLQIIALTEGVKITDDILRILLDTAGSDIRKNLLQLQMLILSKVTFSSLTFIHPSFESKREGNFRTDTSNDNTVKPKELTIQEYSCLLRHMSIIDMLDPNISKNNEEMYNYKRNNIAADPQYSENYGINNITYELHKYCQDNLHEAYSADLPSITEILQSKRWRTNVHNASRNTLSNIVPKYGTHCVGHVDYLPVIRAINRSEEIRLAHSTKRTSRYFHYLKSIGIGINDSENRVLGKSFA